MDLSAGKFLFLGDYVDRGLSSLEVYVFMSRSGRTLARVGSRRIAIYVDRESEEYCLCSFRFISLHERKFRCLCASITMSLRHYFLFTLSLPSPAVISPPIASCSGGDLLDRAQDLVPVQALHAAGQPRNPGRERLGRALRGPELHRPVQEPLWGVRGRTGECLL